MAEKKASRNVSFHFNGLLTKFHQEDYMLKIVPGVERNVLIDMWFLLQN